MRPMHPMQRPCHRVQRPDQRPARQRQSGGGCAASPERLLGARRTHLCRPTPMQASVSWAPKTLPNQPAKAPAGERQRPKFQTFREIRQTTRAGADLSHTGRPGPLKTISRKRASCGALAPRGETGVQSAQAPHFRKNTGASGAECVSLTVGLYTQRKGACSSVT